MRRVCFQRRKAAETLSSSLWRGKATLSCSASPWGLQACVRPENPVFIKPGRRLRHSDQVLRKRCDLVKAEEELPRMLLNLREPSDNEALGSGGGAEGPHARPPQARDEAGPPRGRSSTPRPPALRPAPASRSRLCRTACRPSGRRGNHRLVKGKRVLVTGGRAAALSQPGPSARPVLLSFLDINCEFQCKGDSAVLWGGAILSFGGLARPQAPAVTTKNVSRP